MSDGNLDLSGSETLGWYTLSGDREDYISATVIGETLLDECIALADDDLDFSEFYGVNLFFNAEFNALASGFAGRRIIPADNAGMLAFTALGAPTWQWHAAVAHEMARAMGLRLTDNSDEDQNVYDNPWTLMSDSRAYANVDPLFNFRAKFINAHDLEQMGWLDEANIFTLDRTFLNNNITLEIDLDMLYGAETGNALAFGNRLIRFESSEPGTQYYLEARERDGLYDGALPGSGVLIHEVVDTQVRTARLYHDASLGDAADYADSVNDVWTEGESVDVDGVEISVTGSSSTGFTLRFYSPNNFDPEFPRGSVLDPSNPAFAGQAADNVVATATNANAGAGNTNLNGNNVTTVIPGSGSTGNPGSNTTASTSGGGGATALVLLGLLLLQLAARRQRSV